MMLGIISSVDTGRSAVINWIDVHCTSPDHDFASNISLSGGQLSMPGDTFGQAGVLKWRESNELSD
eukprot:1175325-Prymnesium_polylepis.1